MHPASLDLEAFACGDHIAGVGDHLDVCGACKAFVAKMKAASEAFVASTPIEEVVRVAERLAGASERIAKGEARIVALDARTRRADWRMVLLPMVAVAAGVLLWWKVGTGGPARSGPVAMNEPAVPASTAEPETAFKGGAQVAAIRDRDGDQQRFTSAVGIRGGDRLRIEVALDRPRTILAGVLAEDGAWLDLMTEGTRGAGTHFSEQAARFDDQPMRGWILVGPPDAIAQSRAAHAPRGGVVSMPLGWEGR
jgi:hypothetical protein